MAKSPSVSLRGLRTFCVAARHENFRAAGEELFITASAVSHQIKALEQELGQTLFERNKRELKLTPVGRDLYEEVQPLLAELGEVTARFKLARRKPQLRISVQPFFASEYFVPRLAAFTEAHPDIDIKVGTSDEASEKHPKDADLSIRLFRQPPEHLVASRLFPLTLVPSGSKAFRKQLRVKGDRIVSRFPRIIHESFPRAWQEWSEKSGIHYPEDAKTTRLDSMIAIVRAAEQGLGAALVPVPIAEQWFRQQTIVELFDAPLVTEHSYYLVCRRDRLDDPNVVLFREWVLENFSDHA